MPVLVARDPEVGARPPEWGGACLLGIDLGTSGLKAAVFDLDGTMRGKGTAANAYRPGPPGWAEQDPRAWWTGCARAVRAAVAEAGIGQAEIAGVGVCGFHHCPVLLAEEGEPARDSIVTHDSRLGESLGDLRRSGVLDRVSALAGSPVMAGHLPPILHYVRQHDRAALERTRWVLAAKDYLRYRLTGEIGTEICDATGMHLVAMPDQDWSAALCELLGVPREKLPRIGEPGGMAGRVTSEAADATGLRAGTPVAYGGGDSHCALLGLGVIGSGQAGLLLGTNSTLRASFAGFVRLEGQAMWAQQHVVPGRYTVSASSMAGSSVLGWLKDICPAATAGDDAAAYRELETLAAAVAPGCDGLLFHPYLYGERSPFSNPYARGAFVGLAHWHGRGHLARAVMEGIAFAVANCLEAVQRVARERDEPVTAIRTGLGGGSRLAAWRQILADALGMALQVVPVEEPGCLGAALLAGVAVGAYADVQSAAARAVPAADRVEPERAAAAVYRDRRAAFNDSYRVLEPVLYRPPGEGDARYG